MAKQILGKVVPIVKGNYSSSTQYAMLDIVYYNGSSYIAKTSVIGQAPTNTTYWQLLAKQGDKPVYKVDYLTDAEMDEIVADIISDSTNAFNQNVTAKTTAFNNNATDKTSAFNSNATSKTNDFNSNATSKTTAFNNNAIDKTSDYNTNASSTKDDFDRNATSKTTTFNDNATSKTNSYNSNASDKTTAYNNNASAKTTAFNDNATAKTTAYNNNAQAKIDEYDGHVVDFQAELDETTEELNRYKTLENALPHVNGEGESITLNDTANSPLGLELEPNISQYSTIGKNLLEIPDGTYTSDGITAVVSKGEITLNGTAQATPETVAIYLTRHITIPANTTYTLSAFNTETVGDATDYAAVRLGAIDNNNPYNNAMLQNENSKATISSNDEHEINAIYIRSNENVTFENFVVYPQLELGNGTNTWEQGTNGVSPNSQYPQDIHVVTGDNKIIVSDETETESQELSIDLDDIEYCKIGDYKDRFFKNISGDADYDALREEGKWYLKKNIRKVVLDGTENWEIIDNTSYSNDILRFRHEVTNGNKANPDFAGVLSNYFSGHTLTIRDVEGIARQQDASALNVFINKSNLAEETVAGFKTWLSTHNIIAEYITQNSEYELLDNTLQSQLETIYNKLLGYQEQTNISQENDDLAFNIKAKAIYDLNKLVERVTELENE